MGLHTTTPEKESNIRELSVGHGNQTQTTKNSPIINYSLA